MKKKIVAIACAAAMMLALPTLAWAAPSPSNNGTATGDNGVTAVVKAGSGAIEGVASTAEKASNVPAGTDVVASFKVTGDATDVSLTFNVGAKYAGYAYTVYVEHNDGTTEALTGTVAADGTISIHVDKLSVFSIAIGAAGTTANSNAGSTSPQTGVDLGTVAGATVVTAIAAGAVFVALRKKVTE
ncbi:hypothetical protein [Gordonibacter massiliensis (ex Traore et al. 2017)]|uniref:LPXTG cell wall anchor domain-containing protein n=1 Tax=Gordonibacter massiliensis (ex Traore et al. 2017) TaxID=1841863 RepID=A0A842JJC3_9ACTN|nr:hypothetical protein [Gordonibacter massiliensis (ex Traore et al. 2017)]MBC2889928.1 hypothetical protein [Gordonibacter massiliensis (ex Traore et al. 2017)]